MSNINLIVLKSLLTRDVFVKYENYLDDLFSSKEEEKIFQSIKHFYSTQDQSVGSVDNLELLFYMDFPVIRNKDKSLYETIFQRMKGIEVSPELADQYINQCRKSKIATELAVKALELSEGKGDAHALTLLMEQLQAAPEAAIDEVLFEDTDLDAILADTVDKPGLRWRLNCLNQSIGPLRQGDFGFIFKRPETGGTSFLASNVTFMAAQTDRPVIWFNNEEQTKKVILRSYQAASGYTLGEIYKDREKAKADFRANGGSNIWFRSSHSDTYKSIYNIISDNTPALVIFDQIDKIKGFKADREDLELGAIYQWAREIAAKYCPVIGVCQAGASAHDKMWLTMDDVMNSKTQKQAEADWMLGIGCVLDEGKKNLRYLSVPKNKLVGGMDSDEAMRHGKMTVIFKPEICLFKDVV